MSRFMACFKLAAALLLVLSPASMTAAACAGRRCLLAARGDGALEASNSFEGVPRRLLGVTTQQTFSPVSAEVQLQLPSLAPHMLDPMDVAVAKLSKFHKLAMGVQPAAGDPNRVKLAAGDPNDVELAAGDPDGRKLLTADAAEVADASNGATAVEGAEAVEEAEDVWTSAAGGALGGALAGYMKGGVEGAKKGAIGGAIGGGLGYLAGEHVSGGNEKAARAAGAVGAGLGAMMAGGGGHAAVGAGLGSAVLSGQTIGSLATSVGSGLDSAMSGAAPGSGGSDGSGGSGGSGGSEGSDSSLDGSR